MIACAVIDIANPHLNSLCTPFLDLKQDTSGEVLSVEVDFVRVRFMGYGSVKCQLDELKFEAAHFVGPTANYY